VSHDPRAREQVILRFAPLAEHWARRFAGSRESAEDLSQVAHLGLIQAVDRYDDRRNARFSTFASATITGELKHHLRDRTWPLGVPRRIKEAALEVREVERRLAQEVGAEPSADEVAEAIGVSPEVVEEARGVTDASSTASLDAVSEDGTTLEPPWRDDVGVERADAWMEAASKIRRLPDRERTVLYLSFFEGKTQSEIGREIGVSQMHVSRLRERALARVRAALSSRERRPHPRPATPSNGA